jgi:hypothetical protein
LSVTGIFQLYRSVLHGAEAEAPVLISSIGTQWSAQFPVISPDELTLYFGSSSADPVARGSSDIWMATRASVDAPFGTPMNIAELNTTDFEYPQWISLDGCRLYFTRSGSSGYLSYMAERVGN